MLIEMLELSECEKCPLKELEVRQRGFYYADNTPIKDEGSVVCCIHYDACKRAYGKSI